MDIDQLTNIFCEIDDFCKELDNYYEAKLLSPPNGKRRGPPCCLSDSEIMTILVFFQASGIRNFKKFYICYLYKSCKKEFRSLPSYNRFIEIMNRVAISLALFSQTRSGKITGIYYIDSTCLPVSHIRRSSRNKTFKEVAEHGRTSVGWFFGLKLHIVINDQGELAAFSITKGNVHDAKAGELLLTDLEGMAFGDKGYIGKELFSKLLADGLKLITRARKNMKKKSFSKLEKQLLNQRGIIETVINQLKNHYHLWHTRHRSMANAMTYLMAAMAAYIIEPLKISAIKLLSGNYLLTETPN